MKTLKELESEIQSTIDFEYLQPVDAACEKCGAQLYLDTRMVLTTYPPQYTYVCKRCNNTETSYLRLKTENLWVIE